MLATRVYCNTLEVELLESFNLLSLVQFGNVQAVVDTKDLSRCKRRDSIPDESDGRFYFNVQRISSDTYEQNDEETINEIVSSYHRHVSPLC